MQFPVTNAGAVPEFINLLSLSILDVQEQACGHLGTLHKEVLIYWALVTRLRGPRLVPLSDRILRSFFPPLPLALLAPFATVLCEMLVKGCDVQIDVD